MVTRAERTGMMRWLTVAGLLLLVLFPAAVASAATPDDAAHERLSPSLREMDQWGEHARVAKTMLVLIQVAVMLAAAKLLGWLSERINVPGVIGELLAGVLIGPYVLGHMIQIPLGSHWAPLFPAPITGEWPVNDVIWTMAQFASIVLLFITGLHTDLQQFLKYVGPATLIAIVGLIAPFALGFAAVYYIPAFNTMAATGPGEGAMIPALFVGAILAATSIGITARVLGDINKLDTPEGVTILGAAVLDDVLGIIALAIVGGIASAGAVSGGTIAVIAGKAFGFWIGLTGIVLLLSKPIERALTGIKYSGALIGLGLALAFICSAAAEGFGLAFIIGAYSVGLGLSRTEMSHKLMEKLEPIGDFIVPIFFAALGMLVNVRAMFASWDVIVFGLVITAVAVVGKLVGCGAAALPTGFNARGAYRIGLGMLPRGEVALIVAGIGLSRQLVGEVVFGVSIMMTLITTIVAPILLVPAFSRGGSGLRRPREKTPNMPSISVAPGLEVKVPPVLCDLFVDRLLKHAESAGWKPSYENADDDIYLLRNAGDAAQVRVTDDVIHVDASDSRQPEFFGFITSVRDRIVREVAEIGVETSAAVTGEAGAASKRDDSARARAQMP
jgi:Kef-type K+ transport system membrane component KefB